MVPAHVLRLSKWTFHYTIHIRLFPSSLTMDVNKCIPRHNKIFKHGWMESAKIIEDFDWDCKMWFDY
jgi:hypothetical protein